MSRYSISLLGLVLVALCVTESVGQPPPPRRSRYSVWTFLGIPDAYNFVRDSTINRFGNTPRMERKPPVKRIADPENLESDNPAIKNAAEIKKAEDEKRQKIKAIKYLAKIGCGCYDKDGAVSDALLASATQDCTEAVRYQAVKAIGDSTKGECCQQCGSKCCCSEKVMLALSKIAYERDDTGCFIEPSERVRQEAINSMQVCCPDRGPAMPIEEAIEVEPAPQQPPRTEEKKEEIEKPESVEKPEGSDDVEGSEGGMGEGGMEEGGIGEDGMGDDIPPPPPPPANGEEKESTAGRFSPPPLPTSIVRAAPHVPALLPPANQAHLTSGQYHSPQNQTHRLSSPQQNRSGHAVISQSSRPTAGPEGAVVFVNPKLQLAHLHFHQSRPELVGKQVSVVRQVNGRTQKLGEVKIVYVKGNSANARPAGSTSIAQFARGDIIVLPKTNHRRTQTAARTQTATRTKGRNAKPTAPARRASYDLRPRVYR